MTRIVSVAIGASIVSSQWRYAAGSVSNVMRLAVDSVTGFPSLAGSLTFYMKRRLTSRDCRTMDGGTVDDS